MAKQQSVSIVYEDSSNKQTIAVNGAFGGPTPDSFNVVAHLYVEHRTVPHSISHPVDEKGNVDFSNDKSSTVSRGDVRREVQATLLLSPENSIRLGQFLLDKGAIALQNRGKFSIEDDASEEDSGE